MKKEVVRTGGDSIGIRFNLSERRVHKINLGSVVDLTDMVVINQDQASENISNLMAKQKQPEAVNKIKEIVSDDSGFVE